VIEHEIKLDLASGAQLTIRYFSDSQMRWIFSYDYVGEKNPGETPTVVNKTRLTADYTAGVLDPKLVLSMHVVIPSRLGRKFYVGVDISPGAKTYLEFTYERTSDTPDKYALVEICKGARERVRFDQATPDLVRQIEFPFPIPDRVAYEFGKLSVPFLSNAGIVDYFKLPWSTVP
jgi:hypothetical protein